MNIKDNTEYAAKWSSLSHPISIYPDTESESGKNHGLKVKNAKITTKINKIYLLKLTNILVYLYFEYH
jgi:hypothetical protein